MIITSQHEFHKLHELKRKTFITLSLKINLKKSS